jgi:parvulin-like peptidyl-prolyl isomerase
LPVQGVFLCPVYTCFQKENPVPNTTEKTVPALFALLMVLGAACLPAALSAPAQAAASITIAATVNDDVITREDVDNRLALYLAGNPNKPPPAVRVQLEKQILDKLIDEKLQLQEAQNLGIVVDKKDIEDGFGNIAEQNHLTADQFKEQLTRAGVHLSTLDDQIRAELAWAQVVRRKLGPEVSVSENDITSAENMINRSKGKPIYQVAEILLTVPNEAKDAEVRRGAQRLIDQISHGAPFSAVARQFSQAPGAGTGGDLGWVKQGQLDPKLDAALQKLHPGQISPPIRTDKGYHILFLRNQSVIGGKDAAATDGTATAAAENNTPENKSAEAAPAAADGKPQDGTAAAEAAPQSDVKKAAEISAEEKTRTALANQIGMQRLGQMQEQYLSDLRASAFIDKRL